NVATQVFVNAGFVVLEPNPRGSIGYGKAWREANRHDWGGKDLEDVALGAAWLGDQKLADPARIGVYGGRHRGYLTLISLALRDGGKTHEYHVYPGEGHGFRVTENRIDSLRRALDWFERHLRQA